MSEIGAKFLFTKDPHNLLSMVLLRGLKGARFHVIQLWPPGVDT